MTELKIVYDKITRKIVPHVWNDDGTVTIIASGIFNLDNVVVSMVDVNRVDFVNCVILIDEDLCLENQK